MMQIGLPFGSFLAATLVLVLLPSHWRARNVSTLSIILWLALVNVIQGIDSIIWANNVDIRFVPWCDIVIRISVGSNIALPAACFCLCMHLERVASVRMVHDTYSDKRRRMIIDLLLCYGVPMVYMALFYVVQGHRFDIVENFGCRPESYVSIPEFFLVRLPPLLFSIGTFVYAGLAFIHFVRRRATFAIHLQNSMTTLTPPRYFRLMAMALLEMFWSLLVTVLNMWYSYSAGLRPWISWSNVHSDFSRIGQFPLILVPPRDLIMTYFLWWTIPVSAYMFFVFFAFGRDAMNEYRVCFRWFRRIILGKRRDASRLLFRAPPPLTVIVTECKVNDSICKPNESLEVKRKQLPSEDVVVIDASEPHWNGVKDASPRTSNGHLSCSHSSQTKAPVILAISPPLPSSESFFHDDASFSSGVDAV